MANFLPKRWSTVNSPFENISIFRLFQRFVFIAKRHFFFSNIEKQIFLTYIA